jgi:Uma2 family endonuclease
MSTQAKTFLTPEQYLEIDNRAEERSEYWQGEMFAMPGASRSHNLIVGTPSLKSIHTAGPILRFLF